ncbi:hypothetical protein BPAE_0797g00010 [Botrytis paeoniae]|uniref:Uncharacterized protein n=1 Tax=Botrytis paeoniae TaxID=278948 RepID=A0A4Z1EK47_9HELO|nr:hypothetical protein BPAE_0797g00010 [Botrytis paeoniae]
MPQETSGSSSRRSNIPPPPPPRCTNVVDVVADVTNRFLTAKTVMQASAGLGMMEARTLSGSTLETEHVLQVVVWVPKMVSSKNKMVVGTLRVL